MYSSALSFVWNIEISPSETFSTPSRGKTRLFSQTPSCVLFVGAHKGSKKKTLLGAVVSADQSVFVALNSWPVGQALTKTLSAEVKRWTLSLMFTLSNTSCVDFGVRNSFCHAKANKKKRNLRYSKMLI